MNLEQAMQQLKSDWRKSSALSKVLAVLFFALSILSIGSLSESIIQMRGFVAIAVEAYTLITAPIREWLDASFDVSDFAFDTFVIYFSFWSRHIVTHVAANANTTFLSDMNEYSYFVLPPLGVFLVVSIPLIYFEVTPLLAVFVATLISTLTIANRQNAWSLYSAFLVPYLVFAVLASVAHGISAPLD